MVSFGLIFAAVVVAFSKSWGPSASCDGRRQRARGTDVADNDFLSAVGLTAVAALALTCCGFAVEPSKGFAPPAQAANDANAAETSGPGDRSCPRLGLWDGGAAAFEDEVLALANAARARGGRCGAETLAPKGALKRSAELACVARAYAKQMKDGEFFSHTGDDGSSLADRVNAAQISWHGLGENIASGQATPAEVMDSWLNSEGHCRNLFSDFSQLGVGYYRGVWVQDFVEP